MLHIYVSLECPVSQEADKIVAAVVVDKSVELATLLLDEVGYMFGTLVDTSLISTAIIETILEPLWFAATCGTVVAQFYGGDNHAAGSGDHIGYDQREISGHDTLDNEEQASETHQKKRRKGYAVGVACADGVNGLGQITADHTDGRGIPDYGEKNFIHRCQCILFIY